MTKSVHGIPDCVTSMVCMIEPMLTVIETDRCEVDELAATFTVTIPVFERIKRASAENQERAV